MNDLYLAPPKYCLDSSSIIQIKNYYPKDIFSKLNEFIINIFCSGKVAVVQAVIEEVKSDIYEESIPVELVKKHLPSERIHNLEDHIIESQRIIRKYYDRENKNSHKIKADPMIVACASKFKYTVVTDERRTGYLQIPAICESEKIQCLPFLDFLRKESFNC